jgi:hypothetical protein
MIAAPGRSVGLIVPPRDAPAVPGIRWKRNVAE